MRNHHLFHAAEGALGGLIGTAFLMQGLGLASKLPEPMRPPSLTADPGELMTRKAESILGRSLPKPAHDVVAHGLHWGYGTTWGTLLGLGTPYMKSWKHALLAGAGMGAASWAAGYVGWLPATGLTAPVHKQGKGHVATALLSHVLYGVVAAIPMFAMHRWTATRPRGLRALLG
jgi:hypothetical protein